MMLHKRTLLASVSGIGITSAGMATAMHKRALEELRGLLSGTISDYPVNPDAAAMITALERSAEEDE